MKKKPIQEGDLKQTVSSPKTGKPNTLTETNELITGTLESSLTKRFDRKKYSGSISHHSSDKPSRKKKIPNTKKRESFVEDVVDQKMIDLKNLMK